MPTWGGVLKELNAFAASSPGVAPFDPVRRKYLGQIAKKTGRSVILYATKWTQPSDASPELTSIGPEDIQGLMEVVHGLSNYDGLDLILHAPGGSAEATEALVTYLRSKFKNIRVFVPHAAMSAATMLATAADRIVLGKHSFLGPIDPQLIMPSENGITVAAAHAILEQFALAQSEIKADPRVLPSWLPILRNYGPALIVQCKLALQLAESLVEKWLSDYMFAGKAKGPATAKAIASKLADHAHFKSHGRFIPRSDAKALGLVVEDMEADQALQDDVLSVFHATTHTFNSTPAVKIIENHLGKAFIKAHNTPQMLLPPRVQLVPPGLAFPPGP